MIPARLPAQAYKHETVNQSYALNRYKMYSILDKKTNKGLNDNYYNYETVSAGNHVSDLNIPDYMLIFWTNSVLFTFYSEWVLKMFKGCLNSLWK